MVVQFPGDFQAHKRMMERRVRNILLVASHYDSFIVEQDGGFEDQLQSKYLEMKLSTPPRFETVASSDEAFASVRKGDFQIVIATPHFEGVSPIGLARALKAEKPDISVMMLTYDRVSAVQYAQLGRPMGMDPVFLWGGDPEVLLAMVKLVEDRNNVDADTGRGVRVILVVEDSPLYYSYYLPTIFQVVMEQTRSLMPGRLNAADRLYRIRARPKILLARTWEEAIALYDRYRQRVMSVISDMAFPRNNVIDDRAGLALIRRIRADQADIPILLQSAETDLGAEVESLGVTFADKSVRDLRERIKNFMKVNVGFGPFVFHMPDQTVVAEAQDLYDMVRVLRTVPEESLSYHASRNHISIWLNARTEFAIADEVRPMRIDEFSSPNALRGYLIGFLGDFLHRQQRGLVTDFVPDANHLARDFTRIGADSLGGKARGLAFLSHLIARHDEAYRRDWPQVRLGVPRTTVLCTDLFDSFCLRFNLRERAQNAASDEAIDELFMSYELDADLCDGLRDFLGSVDYPLAVRSSALAEDSEFQPLAGLYRTCILPNMGSPELRLEHLSQAIRRVWASTFHRGPRRYVEATTQGPGEEKMAVIIQQLVGRRYGSRFYPHFSGVAQSYNYYPIRYVKPEDGFVSLALGLGKGVVDGGKTVRFSPGHPQILVEMSSAAESMRNSQRSFWSLDLASQEAQPSRSDEGHMVRLPIEAARVDGSLEVVGATYDPENDRIYDTIHREGFPVVTFAPIIKLKRFPLATLLQRILKDCREGLGTDVEIEFAGNVDLREGKGELVLLQCRPLVTSAIGADVELAVHEGESLVLMGKALGNGVINEITDVVYVHPGRFQAGDTPIIAREIADINERLIREGRKALMIGPGRWGTSDPWLGIPVEWDQVSSARAFVELAIPGFRVDPSQGTHFFHNITSLRVAYFTLDLTRGDALDLSWLESLEAERITHRIRHVRLPAHLEVRVDGRTQRGMVVRGH